MSKADAAGTLCTYDSTGKKKVADNPKLNGLTSGGKSESAQIGSLRKNPGARFQGNETAGIKGK